MMETIACSCPAVVGDLEAMADLLEPDEADLRVFSVDVQALANRVIAVLEQPEEACRCADRMRVRLSQRLSWDSIAWQYTEILYDILPHHRP